MDKYIGNKKSIVDGIESFLNSKSISEGIIIDVFSGTTNVGQYFKQRGYSIISNDINDFSYILGNAYLVNNKFPEFKRLIDNLHNIGFTPSTKEIEVNINYVKRKVEADKIFPPGYYEDCGFEEGIKPLLCVLEYLNNISITNLSQEELLFYNYYTICGEKSHFRSTRGTEGKRNYFSGDNAKRLGKIMETIKRWRYNELISQMELYILLACVIEEVTLNANVNGTFHDFNRNKLYPNAQAQFKLKPIMLNIYEDSKKYYVFKEDANLLINNENFNLININDAVLYIDPPYNFRQYSAYYHLLNFLAIYNKLDNVLEYAEGFKFVRGQNMKNNFNSRYCYKDEFIDALSELIEGVKSKHVLISYYDENNHWNHGKKQLSLEGRTAIVNIFRQAKCFSYYDMEPYIIRRRNYQSQSGGHKKTIEELLFYARR